MFNQASMNHFQCHSMAKLWIQMIFKKFGCQWYLRKKNMNCKYSAINNKLVMWENSFTNKNKTLEFQLFFSINIRKIFYFKKIAYVNYNKISLIFSFVCFLLCGFISLFLCVIFIFCYSNDNFKFQAQLENNLTILSSKPIPNINTFSDCFTRLVFNQCIFVYVRFFFNFFGSIWV